MWWYLHCNKTGAFSTKWKKCWFLDNQELWVQVMYPPLSISWIAGWVSTGLYYIWKQGSLDWCRRTCFEFHRTWNTFMVEDSACLCSTVSFYENGARQDYEAIKYFIFWWYMYSLSILNTKLFARRSHGFMNTSLMHNWGSRTPACLVYETKLLLGS